MYGLGAARASGAVPESLSEELAGTVTLGSYETGPGIKALAATTKKFTANTGHRRQDQHGRPQHVPEPDQQLPAGQAGRRVHVVRRLPDAVLRREGPGHADRRCLEGADAPDAAVDQGRLDRARRAPVPRAEQELPVGRLLPQEPLEGKGLHGSDDVGSVHRPGQEDAGRRAHADRLHRQGRLARDGHVRHPQHADQRLPVPRRPDGRQGSLGRRAGEGRLQAVGGAPPVLLGRARSA